MEIRCISCCELTLWKVDEFYNDILAGDTCREGAKDGNYIDTGIDIV